MIPRLIDGYTRYYALWVVLGGLAAYLAPGLFLPIKPHIATLFAVTMFGIGATLQPSDFARIARQPWIVAVGVTAQYTLMPLGAWALSRALRLPDEVAIGLILTGAAPGAMASNVMSYIARADVAYSVSLTTVSTLLSPLMTPGLTLLLAGASMDVSFWAMFKDVLWMVVLPLLAGFGVRALFPRPVQRIETVFPALSATFIVLICAVVIASNVAYLPQVTGLVLVACVALNLYGLCGGYAVAKTCRMNLARRRTLSIEIGMQNAGLGVTLALAHLGDRAAVPAAIFVFVCIITASLLPALWRRFPAEAEPAAEAA